jgi:hypothetical protein
MLVDSNNGKSISSDFSKEKCVLEESEKSFRKNVEACS